MKSQLCDGTGGLFGQRALPTSFYLVYIPSHLISIGRHASANLVDHWTKSAAAMKCKKRPLAPGLLGASTQPAIKAARSTQHAGGAPPLRGAAASRLTALAMFHGLVAGSSASMQPDAQQAPTPPAGAALPGLPGLIFSEV